MKSSPLRDSRDSKIIITGATGNTGIEVAYKLRCYFPDREILALVRQESNITRLTNLNIECLVCDLERPETYATRIIKGDIFLEIANLRHARRMLPIMSECGVKRAFCVTTTGVFSEHQSYATLYNEIEQELRDSAVDVTILRPSMIYGNELDHNMHKLLKIIHRFPIYPVFGNGRALMQPVHVDDLAEGIVQAVIRDAHGEYNLAGPEALSYRDIIDQAFTASERRGFLLFIPTAPVAILAGLLESLPGFPIKKEQVIRLQEDKNFDILDSKHQLGYSPRPFAVGIAQEVIRLRQVGHL